MSTATLEIYRTESGSVYEVVGGRIRRSNPDGRGVLGEWQEYAALTRLPAALMRRGSHGEVLEVVLRNGKRITTSRLVLPFTPSSSAPSHQSPAA